MATTKTNIWDLARKALKSRQNVLLCSEMPGLGKTFLSNLISEEEKGKNRVYPIAFTRDMPSAEVRGHHILTGNEFEWMDGPGTAAMRNGGTLICHDINLGSPEVMSMMQLLADNRSAKLTLPNKKREVISASPGYKVIATMNGAPEDLYGPLADRFPIQLVFDEPNPDAVAALPEDLRPLVNASQESGKKRGLRKLFAFAELREEGVMTVDEATEAIFASEAAEIRRALAVGSKK